MVLTAVAMWKSLGGLPAQGHRTYKAAKIARKQQICIQQTKASASSSFDADDELDLETSRVFSQFSDPAKARAYAKHLELIWTISEGRPKPARCACCHGSGQRLCTWCRGSGALTLGDTVYCSETGCSPCPICTNTGTVECQHCKGTGFRAGWLEQGCPL